MCTSTPDEILPWATESETDLRIVRRVKPSRWSYLTVLRRVLSPTWYRDLHPLRHPSPPDLFSHWYPSFSRQSTTSLEEEKCYRSHSPLGTFGPLWYLSSTQQTPRTWVLPRTNPLLQHRHSPTPWTVGSTLDSFPSVLRSVPREKDSTRGSSRRFFWTRTWVVVSVETLWTGVSRSRRYSLDLVLDLLF